MARLLAGFLATDEKKIAVASTGVIGRYMDLPLISRCSSRLKAGYEAMLWQAKRQSGPS